jgi:hypothetical protein
LCGVRKIAHSAQVFYAERAYKIANRSKLLIPAVAFPM